uniref:DNA polymerase n=1 Tax=Streptomyces phage Scarif TaxID=3158858 RepID=A0AAU7GZ14_9CAUD
MRHIPKAYNELTSLLLSSEDLAKFEWAIGAMLSGGPRHILLVHGAPGSGKSTLLEIVRKILLSDFRGHFAPRVSFQHDGYFEVDDDTFVYAATPAPIVVEGAIDIFTTGDRVPVNKHYVLMNQIDVEALDVGEHCINVYENNVQENI